MDLLKICKKKKSKIRLPIPAELLNEIFAALPLKNGFGLLVGMPNELLARNLRRMINRMKMGMKSNTLNIEDCGSKLTISKDGLTSTKFGQMKKYSAHAISPIPIPKLSLIGRKGPVAFYFECQILRTNCFISIGFCDRQFPLEAKRLGNVQNSIGIWHKAGMAINRSFVNFKGSKGKFIRGDVIGIGVVHSRANPTMKCFVTFNGALLGEAKLPAKFADIQLFPAATLLHEGDSIRMNFGKDEWLYDPSQQK